ncbi:AAA family ATPase [Flavivirga spongiicola]|uniref:Helicase RepA family protein n=1 Tax=Flavivirga spongiicola TaxID=421621 RepID=A0ABU7XUD3_9FLAO|nr:AAA family ATPase [Flavivirga sp. MEBiC05379]MDO5979186.1 AAA family ATPase [Flavivirga sp. MEBiC05379]
MDKTHNKKHTKRLKKALKKYEVDSSEKLKPPEIAWGMFDKTQTKFSILGTLSNFGLVTGKAKSRKSFFINIVTSVASSNDKLLSQYQSRLPKGKRGVLYFDTEQSRYHVQAALKRVCKQIGVPNPKNLKVYGLRSLNPEARLKLIEFAIYNNPKVGFVVIDGIKDLIKSINSEEEATEIASKLLKWTEECNIHIVCVLHQNKGDSNARGHLGSELSHKAETVLSVTRDSQNKDISIVEPVMCRNQEPDDFAFEIIDGLPVAIEDYEFRVKKKPIKGGLLSIPDFEKFQMLNEVYSKKDEYLLTDLSNTLQEVIKTRKPDMASGNNAMRGFIKYLKTKEWLIQEAPRAPYKLGVYKK